MIIIIYIVSFAVHASPQCAFNASIRDTLTFLNLYNVNATMQNSNVNTSEGASLFIIGGGCPDRTEGVAIVAPFLYSLQV